MFLQILALAAVTAAEPINARTWATPNDYPTNALRKSQGGIVSFRLTIADDGKPILCEIIEATGYKEIDLSSCALLLRRSRFEPARDAAGNATFAVYNNSLTWWASGMKPLAQPLRYDATLTVKNLPTNLPNPTLVRLAFAVDALGHTSNCTPAMPDPPARKGSRESKIEQESLDLLGEPACKAIQTDLTLKPAMGREGKPVASVQTIRVMFLEEEGKD